MRKASLLAALLLLTPALSQAKTLEELLVEKGVITKSEAASTSGAATGGTAKVYYNDGTRIEFPDAGFTTKINTLIQTRYSFIDADEEAPAGPFDPVVNYNGVNGTRTNRSSFDVVTARLIVTGTALYNEFAYKLEADLVGTGNDTLLYRDPSGAPDSANLKDAFVVWQPCEGYATKMGQFFTQLSRQGQSKAVAYGMQFADPSVVSEYNWLGRQQGIQQSGEWLDGKLQASAGIFNGLSTGEGTNYNGIDTDHTGVAAIRFNPTGKMNILEEGDVDYTEDLATSFGAAYAYNEGHNVIPGSGVGRAQDLRSQNVSVDANLKVRGIGVHAEYYHNNGKTEHSDLLDWSTNGGYVQAGYFIIPKELEIAGRYAFLDCDNGDAPGLCSGLDNINEAAASINYYFWKHSAKAQLGYAFVNEDRAGANSDFSDVNTNRWTFQFSLYL